nr:MAG TPA: hypothetical protein [Caudoviricetes sp.]
MSPPPDVAEYEYMIMEIIIFQHHLQVLENLVA